ncbi:unnamed protein product [Parnassius mnemosyne]|uniref:FP protein C-terminal domain-containing protein n=1 Tax=Parnassius mnemosyne TaxID=213953 RepID=A0AAV1LPW5_9NEOP
MSADNNDWGCCGDNPDTEEYIKCQKCSKKLHVACLSSPSVIKPSELSTWECPLCTSLRPKTGHNDNTPVRFNPNVTVRASKRQALQSPPIIGASADEVRGIMQEYCKSITSKIDSLTISISSEIKSVKEEMLEIRSSMDFMNSKYELLIKDHKETKQAMVDFQKENSALKTNVKDLTARINTLEQNARAMNVEIQCIPEKKNENLMQVVTQLGTVLKCNVKNEDVINCTRIAKINPNSTRPKSIVAQFANKKIRDEFLAASINFNRKKAMQDKLNSSHLGFNGEKSPIFIVDHLSPMNKSLHAAARKIGKEKGYKHVWVRNGRIFMRKTDNSDYMLIRDMDSLNCIK